MEWTRKIRFGLTCILCIVSANNIFAERVTEESRIKRINKFVQDFSTLNDDGKLLIQDIIMYKIYNVSSMNIFKEKLYYIFECLGASVEQKELCSKITICEAETLLFNHVNNLKHLSHSDVKNFVCLKNDIENFNNSDLLVVFVNIMKNFVEKYNNVKSKNIIICEAIKSGLCYARLLDLYIHRLSIRKSLKKLNRILASQYFVIEHLTL